MSSKSSAEVRLGHLVERKQLHREPAAAEEVQGLLASASDFLRDASRPENSEATRFNVAYEAAHALGLAALRARDLRPAQGPGHRAIVFAVLDATSRAPDGVCVPLMKAHEKRNKLTYDGLTTFSRVELAELVACVGQLMEIVTEGISRSRPELLDG